MLADRLLRLETWLPGLDLEAREFFEALSVLIFSLPPAIALPTLKLFSSELLFPLEVAGAGRTEI